MRAFHLRLERHGFIARVMAEKLRVASAWRNCVEETSEMASRQAAGERPAQHPGRPLLGQIAHILNGVLPGVGAAIRWGCLTLKTAHAPG